MIEKWVEYYKNKTYKDFLEKIKVLKKEKIHISILDIVNLKGYKKFIKLDNGKKFMMSIEPDSDNFWSFTNSYRRNKRILVKKVDGVLTWTKIGVFIMGITLIVTIFFGLW